MDENKIQVKHQVIPSFLGSKPRITWGITCPNEDCYSLELGINAPYSAGWDDQETAMRVAVRHALDEHPKPFMDDVVAGISIGQGLFTVTQGNVSLGNSIAPGTVVKMTPEGKIRPVREPDSELIWTDSIGREVRAKISRFHGIMLCVDGHWVYLGEDGADRLYEWLGNHGSEEIPQHEHDVSCSFGNPQCPAFGEKPEKKNFWDRLRGI